MPARPRPGLARPWAGQSSGRARVRPARLSATVGPTRDLPGHIRNADPSAPADHSTGPPQSTIMGNEALGGGWVEDRDVGGPRTAQAPAGQSHGARRCARPWPRSSAAESPSASPRRRSLLGGQGRRPSTRTHRRPRRRPHIPPRDHLADLHRHVPNITVAYDTQPSGGGGRTTRPSLCQAFRAPGSVCSRSGHRSNPGARRSAAWRAAERAPPARPPEPVPQAPGDPVSARGSQSLRLGTPGADGWRHAHYPDQQLTPLQSR
jgi:hypothetical protein